MGITERVQQMEVAAHSPSGSVSARMRGRSAVSVSFAPGFYHRADEHQMASQLAQVGKLLWAARTREYHRILSDEHQQAIEDSGPVSRQDVEFYGKRDRLIAEGASGDGRLRLAVRGMREWAVAIAPGTLSRLSEDEFTARVTEAAASLIADQQSKIRALKLAVYDPEFLTQFKE